jgi:hypothetical protein
LIERHLDKFFLDLVKVDPALLHVLSKVVEQIACLVLDQRVGDLETDCPRSAWQWRYFEPAHQRRPRPVFEIGL